MATLIYFLMTFICCKAHKVSVFTDSSRKLNALNIFIFLDQEFIVCDIALTVRLLFDFYLTKKL